MNPNPDSKPESKTEPKAGAKTRMKSPTANSKASMLNPVWAEEIVKTRDITGALAKAIAADLQKEAGKILAKLITEDKINKIVRKSFNARVGKANVSQE